MRYTARTVYTLAGEPIENGYVDVAPDGTILAVGHADGPVEEGAICPGFVNAHCHVELSYMKGLFRKGTGMAGFIDQINELRDTSSMDEVKASHPMYTRSFLEVFGAVPEECDSVMEYVTSLQEKAASYGLDAAPTPHSCYTMSPELVTASSAAGLKSGFLSFHSEESSEEEEMMRYGRGPMWDNRVRNGIPTPPVTGTSSLEYFLERVTAAVPAPVPGNVLLVHECCLTPEGAARAREVLQHPYIAVCPLSNLFIHCVLPPIPVMRESGIPICIGTDSLSSNDQLSMIDEIMCLRRAFDVPMQELLTWACLNGARFLGKEGVLGSLEPGKKPGVVRILNNKSTRLC